MKKLKKAAVFLVEMIQTKTNFNQ